MSYEIDTHALIKRLMAKNFTEEQAEEIVKITKEVRQAKLDRMATKRNLREYYYKTIITIASIAVAVGGIIIAVLH